MKKSVLRIVFLFLLVFISFGTFACGGSGGGGGETSNVVLTWYKTPTSQPYTVNILGGSFTLPEGDKIRNGYKFLGLYDQPSGGTQVVNEYGTCNVMITKSMTLYAQWEVQKYNIIFEPREGSLDEAESIATYFYDSSLTVFPIPTREGYDFVGWSNGSGKIYTDNRGLVNSEYNTLSFENYHIDENGNINLYAEYEIKKLIVTFDYNDGSYNTETKEVQYGSVLDPNTFPQSDTGSKRIIGWSIYRNELVEFTGTVGNNITLYAMWQEYKVFNLVTEANQEPSKLTIDKNQELELPTPKKDGYIFEGWFTTSHFSGFPVEKVTYGSAFDTYYAKWSPEQYSITFDINGGSIELDSITYNVTDTFNLPNPGTKENFEFIGWCSKQDLTDTPVNTIEVGSFGDKVLYAKWKGINRNVVLDAKEGIVAVNNQVVEYGAKFNLVVPMLVGYEFEGWYLDNTKLTDKFGESLGTWEYLEEETKLYAKYLQKHYVEITYSHFNAGNITLADYYVIGDNVDLNVVIVDNGYTVKGFYINNILVSDTDKYSFIMPDEDVKISVEFTERIFNVTFDTAGGNMKNVSTTVGYLQDYSFPTPYKEGFIFDGWKFGDLVLTSNTGSGLAKWNVKEDVTLIAIYVEDSNAENTLIIKTADDLMKIKDEPGKTYNLINDIDMIGSPWIPFEFTGTLNGNGYSIKNITVSSSTGNTGLFTVLKGSVNNVVFENLRVSNTSDDTENIATVGGVCGELAGTINGVVIESGDIYGNVAYVGGVAGYISKGKIINSVNKVAVRSLKEGSQTGGIIGRVSEGTIQNCVNYGNIQGFVDVGGIAGALIKICSVKDNTNFGDITGKEKIGGIFGRIASDGTYDVSNLTNNGNVTGDTYVGGITGFVSNDTNVKNTNYTLSSEKLYNYANVTGVTYVGGIFGYINGNNTNTGSNIFNLREYVNDGNITGTDYVAGLVGYGYSDSTSSTINDSSSKGIITAEYRSGGLAGWLENISIADCSNAGTIIAINGSYTSEALKYAYVGGYVGRGHAVNGCINNSNIIYTGDGMCIGGIAGYLFGEINDSSNNGKIEAPKASYVGGLVGSFQTNGDYTISNLTNKGDVTGVDYVGGIFGLLSNDTAVKGTNYTIKSNKVKNTGNITGVNFVAGIFGKLNANNTNTGSNIFNATEYFNEGNITGSDYVGGLIGYGYSDTTESLISSSGSKGTITADYRAGGLAGWLEYICISNCTNEGTEIIANGSYLNDNNKYANIGGYVGRGHSVFGCINNSDIIYSGEGFHVGGIAGYLFGEINDSSNNGKIEAPKASYVGGLVGCVGTDGTYNLKNLKNSNDVTGLNYVGGIFGEIYNTTNVKATNYTISSSKLTNTGNIVGNNYVGGICGNLYTNNTNTGSNILNAIEYKNEGDVTGTDYVGGLIGYAYSDTTASLITESSSKGIITADYRSGGLAGWLEYICISNCTNEGTIIEINGSYIDGTLKYAYIGGYVGRGHSILGCVNNSDIIYAGDGSYIGGLAGFLFGEINKSSNSAKVEANLASYVGGLVGAIETDGSYSLSELKNTGNVTGLNQIGGIIGRIGNETNVKNGVYVITSNDVSNSGEISGNAYVGGIIGYLYGNNAGSGGSLAFKATLYSNEANITGTDFVGGLIGYAYSDTTSSLISESSSKGVITANHRIGGLAGWLEYIALSNCTNEGTTIVANGSYLENNVKYAYIGGYVGSGYSISGCVNNTEIVYEGDGRLIGGLAGNLVNTINNSSNHAKVDAKLADYVGGLVGCVAEDGTYELSNLSNTNDVTGLNYVGGIFGEINNGTNVKATNYTITSNKVNNTGNVTGNYYVAGICGYFYNNNNNTGVNILNAVEYKNEGNVTGIDFVGGLIGYGYTDSASSLITGSSSSGVITANCRVGGLAGWLEYISLNDCTNEGTQIFATGNWLDATVKYAYVGGYVGRGHSITGCINTCEIVYQKEGIYVGGIAGYLFGTINSASNTAKVDAKLASYVGGLVGCVGTDGTYELSNLSNENDVYGLDYVGGIFGEVHNDMNVKSTNYTITSAKVSNKADVTGTNYVGGICGNFYTNNIGTGANILTISEYSNEGNITGSDFVGGLIGYGFSDSSASLISESSSKGTITANSRAGGLSGELISIGLNNCTNEGTIINANGIVTIDGVKYAYVGGYVGHGFSVINCKNASDIIYSGDGQFVGGIAGYLASSISDSSNSGKIEAINSNYVGGLVGRIGYNGTYTIANLSNTGEVTGKDLTGGIIGELYNITNSSTTYTLTLTNISNEAKVTGLNYVAGAIGNLYANNTSSGSNVIKASLIKNTSDITGVSHVGGLIGYGYSDTSASMLNECSSSGTISAQYKVGGLAGWLENICLVNCSNKNTEINATGFYLESTTKTSYIGGYVGRGHSITGCINDTKISYYEAGSFVGGIAGYLAGSINDSTNNGSIEAKESNFVGGLVGYIPTDGNYSLNNLTNNGLVTGYNFIGGIIGEVHNDTNAKSTTYTISSTNLVNTAKITGNEYVAGIVGHFYADNAHNATNLLNATYYTNSGDVVAVGLSGGFFGRFYTDGQSKILIYSCSGNMSETIVGENTNLTLTEG